MAEQNTRHACTELYLESTIFHEGVHVGTGKQHTQPRASYKTKNEEGKEFEKAAYGEDIDKAPAQRIANPTLTATPPKLVIQP